MRGETRSLRPVHQILAAIVLAVGILLIPGEAQAQGREEADSLRREIEALRARLDSLAAIVKRLQAKESEEDPLSALRAAAREAAGGAVGRDTAAQEFTGRQRSLQALNPEISVNVDLFAHLNPDDLDEQHFIPREFEFSFASTLDPFSRAKIFAGIHSPGPEVVPFEEHGHHEEAGGGGGEFAIEEGYVEWVGLPGGLGLKLGKFFQRFGTMNRWHSHALYFQSRSLPHIAFIGEDALAQTGGSLSWLVPLRGFGTYELTGEVTRGSNESLFGESSRPTGLGHLNAFYEISRSTDLDLGFSWLRGQFEEEGEESKVRNLLGVETAFTWRPPERSLYRGLVLRGGVMAVDGLAHEEHEEEEHGEGPEDGMEGVDEDENGTRAMGLWSMAELRLSKRVLAGARFDRTENPAHPEESAWLLSPTLTWWQSEWVRIRLEYDLVGRSFLEGSEGRFFLGVTFAMGPHKHATY